MNPELISVVKERVDLGHSDQSIKEELINAGYKEDVINKVIEAARSDSEVVASIIPQADMPRAVELINISASYILKRYDLALLLLAPLVFVSLLEYLEVFAGSEQAVIKMIFDIFTILSIATYFIIFISVLYIVSFLKEKEILFKEALAWTLKNIWGFIFINVLTTLVVIGGFVLLIVPGIILSVYIYFSQFVFAIEGKKGMDALLRSKDLVRGNWLKVAGRVVVVYLLLFLLFTLLGVVGSFLVSLVSDGVVVDFLSVVSIQLVSVLVSMVGLCIGVEMYRWLATQKPANSSELIKGKYVYVSIAALGFLFTLFMFSTVAYLYSVYGEEYFEAGYEESLNLDTNELDYSGKERASELRLRFPLGEETRE